MRHSRRRHTNTNQSRSSPRCGDQHLDRLHQRPRCREYLRQRAHYSPYRRGDQRSASSRTRRRERTSRNNPQLSRPLHNLPFSFSSSEQAIAQRAVRVEESDILSHKESPESSEAAQCTGPSLLRPLSDTSHSRETTCSHADIRTPVCHHDLSTFSLPSSYSSFHFQFSSVGEARLFDRSDER